MRDERNFPPLFGETPVMKKHSLASLFTVAGLLASLLASADPPPPNTQQPNMELVRRVRCVAAAYRIASTPAQLSPGMPRMQPVTEASFLNAFAGTGECVGLDAQSALVLLRAQQATLVGGGSVGSTGLGLPTPPPPPMVAPPPPPTATDAGVATAAADVPGVTVVPPVNFVLAPADAGTAAPTPTATDAGARAERCPHGSRCGSRG